MRGQHRRFDHRRFLLPRTLTAIKVGRPIALGFYLRATPTAARAYAGRRQSPSIQRSPIMRLPFRTISSRFSLVAASITATGHRQPRSLKGSQQGSQMRSFNLHSAKTHAGHAQGAGKRSPRAAGQI